MLYYFELFCTAYLHAPRANDLGCGFELDLGTPLLIYDNVTISFTTLLHYAMHAYRSTYRNYVPITYIIIDTISLIASVDTLTSDEMDYQYQFIYIRHTATTIVLSLIRVKNYNEHLQYTPSSKLIKIIA
jgi:hypothetical protein